MDRQELFRQVLSDLNRLDKGDMLPGWLESAEFIIHENLRHERMVKHAVLPVTETVFPVPPNFIDAHGNISIRAGSDPTSPGPILASLRYMPSDQVDDKEGEPDAWDPRGPLWYTLKGRNIVLAGWNKSGPFLVDMWYYGKLDKLPNDTSSNWLLDEANHIYKDAMLYFGFRHLQEFDTADRHLASAVGFISKMNDNAEKRKAGSGALIARPVRGFGSNVRRR